MAKTKDQKRREGEIRNAAWAALSDAEKLSRLRERGMAHTTQFKKIVARMAKVQPAVETGDAPNVPVKRNKTKKGDR